MTVNSPKPKRTLAEDAFFTTLGDAKRGATVAANTITTETHCKCCGQALPKHLRKARVSQGGRDAWRGAFRD
ncbi:hypothetical protein DS909_08840 [Phaeobacter gallaeciensis]|uniref:Uncharacterized protein n=1 Tax=Phaeobacter gallaeciensis TaxID=60890 RepID=A0A366X046_9RHOB|nr:hypothetical protein [Phaeobacter gallaeciensis]RBW56801.1 hypothetical protein DS909_08840 [Phaeobacter gallaeciensis]